MTSWGSYREGTEMPSPESSRRNLEHARSIGRVRIWRPHSESQRVKAEIVWLRETHPELSQRVIARTLHVSQVYVQRILNRVRLSSGIEKAIGEEAYRHYRDRLEAQRRAHFQAQGAPASLIGDSVDNPTESIHVAASRSSAVIMETVDETGKRIQFARSTSGELIEVYDFAPGCNTSARTALAYVPGTMYAPLSGPTPRVHSAAMGTELSVANQWF
jgi:hypothetical protein